MAPDVAGEDVLSTGLDFGGAAGADAAAAGGATWAATWATACSGLAVSVFGFLTA